jgi:hypothetical protein
MGDFFIDKFGYDSLLASNFFAGEGIKSLTDYFYFKAKTNLESLHL